ncbi:hypothetical protein GCM10011494_36510 [Novosphingobium endophyticum]|uniref:Uncharacterized protein n=1 Tax=Novosphingobium endophyticum TaxID=1955250 RepID=A0A916TVQ9_9SPHN|nr:hypothetical protein GCM10011494_36510 [Novosphingobium endophyticum]
MEGPEDSNVRLQPNSACKGSKKSPDEAIMMVKNENPNDAASTNDQLAFHSFLTLCSTGEPLNRTSENMHACVSRDRFSGMTEIDRPALTDRYRSFAILCGNGLLVPGGGQLDGVWGLRSTALALSDYQPRGLLQWSLSPGRPVGQGSRGIQSGGKAVADEIFGLQRRVPKLIVCRLRRFTNTPIESGHPNNVPLDMCLLLAAVRARVVYVWFMTPQLDTS